MTELKTLKDLQGLSFRGECKLRQEAIKWINHWTNEEPPAHGISEGEMMMVYKLEGKKSAFREFFNITDEELKT